MSKSAEREFVRLRKQENGIFSVADDTSSGCWAQAPGKGAGNSSAWVQGPVETLQMLKLCSQSIWLGIGIAAKIQAVILHCVNYTCVYGRNKHHSYPGLWYHIFNFLVISPWLSEARWETQSALVGWPEGGRSRENETRQFPTYTVKPWMFLWMLGISESSRYQGKVALVSLGMDILSSSCINRAFGRKNGLRVTFSKDISGLLLSWVDQLGKTHQVCHLFLIDYLHIIKFLIYWVQALPMMLDLALSWLWGARPAGSDRRRRQMISDIAVRLPELIYPFQNPELAFEHLNSDWIRDWLWQSVFVSWGFEVLMALNSPNK